MKKIDMENIVNRLHGWHSAKKLPQPESLAVLVYSKEWGIREGWYNFTLKDGTMLWSVFTARGVVAIGDVTHWRYFPRAPRQKNKDKK